MTPTSQPKSLLLLLWLIFLSPILAQEIPLGRIWDRVDDQAGENANRFLVDGQTTWAVGDGGLIWSSQDREAWLVEKTLATESFHDLAKGNDTLVVVGDAGSIVTRSADGRWISQPSGVNSALRAIVFGGNRFVAIGDDGVVLESGDGTNWRVWPAPFAKDLNDIIWNGTQFHLVGDDLLVATAPVDGEWTVHPQTPISFPQADYRSIQWTGDEYVINGAFYSADGVTYSYTDDPQPFSSIALAFGGGLNVGLSHSGRVGISEDSRNWTIKVLPAEENFIDLQWTGSQFLAMTPGRRFFHSTDGHRWTGSGLSQRFGSLSDGIWTGTQYVVVGPEFPLQSRSLGLGILTSPDGRNWTSENVPAEKQFLAVATNDDAMVAVGREMTIFRSVDGRDWQTIDLGGDWDLTNVEWTGSEFIALGTDGVIFASSDGTNWQMTNPGELEAATWDGNRFVAVAGSRVFESPDGRQWSFLATSDPDYTGEMADIYWSNGRYLAVGEGPQVVTSTDGVAWQKAESSSFSGQYPACVIEVGGRWFVGGRNLLSYSENGLTWTSVSLTGWPNFQTISHNGSHFLAAGDEEIFTSDDGLTWRLVQNGGRDTYKSIAWTGTEWVVAGDNGGSWVNGMAVILRSPSGTNWAKETIESIASFEKVSSQGEAILAIAEEGRVVRISEEATAFEESGLKRLPIWFSLIGNALTGISSYGMQVERDSSGTWSQGPQRLNSSDAGSLIASPLGLVRGAQGSPGTDSAILFSTNGRSWEEVTPEGGVGRLIDGVWTGSEFVMISSNKRYSSPDGRNWTEVPIPGFFESRSVVYFDQTEIYGGNSINEDRARIYWRNGTGDDGFNQGIGTYLFFIPGPSEVLALSFGGGPNLVSRDGSQWQPLDRLNSSPEDGSDVIHCPLGFVVSDQGGTIRLSNDGEAWQPASSGLEKIFALAFGAGRLVAVGSGIVSSVDGLTWTSSNLNTGSLAFADVTWNGERFVAVGDGWAATSSDGESWTAGEVPEDLIAVAWNGETFVAGGDNGSLFFSTDGASWELKVLPRDIVSHATGNGLTVAATRRGGFYRSVGEGVWELLPDLGESSGSSTPRVTFENGLFFAQVLNSNSGTTRVSASGIDWTPLFTGYRSITWTGTQFIAVSNQYRIHTSPDGFEWTTPFVIGRSEIPYAAVWNGNSLIAVGRNGSAYSLSGDLVWSNLTSGTTVDLHEVVWTGDQIVALDENGVIVFFDEGPPLPEGVTGSGLTMIGDTLTVAAEDGLIATWAGQDWTVTDTHSSVDLKTISIDGTSLIATGRWGTLLRSASLDPTGPWTLETRSGRQAGSIVDLDDLSDELYAMRSDGRFVGSFDGLVWDLDLTSEPLLTRAVLEGEPGEILSFGRNGQIYRTVDRGMPIGEFSGTDLDLQAAARYQDRMVAVGEAGLILVSKPDDELPFDYRKYMASAGAFSEEAAADADWDRDGVSNFLEYVLGFSSNLGSPPDSASNLLTLSGVAPDFEIAFEATLDRPDAKIRILESSDLVTWEEVAAKFGEGPWGGRASISETPTGSAQTRVKIENLASGHRKRFYRLEVQSAAPNP